MGGLGGLGGTGGIGLGGLGGLGAGGSGQSDVATTFRKPGDPPTLHQAFQYADIAAYLLEKPSERSVELCREICMQNASCAAWEVCAPMGNGCEGCYLIRRAPRRLTEREFWHAEILPGREELGWDSAGPGLDNLTAESCHDILLEANGADQSQAFHEPANMQRYVLCGAMVRNKESPRRISVGGQHWPTFVLTNFWDPPVGLPIEVEQELISSQRQIRDTPGARIAEAASGGGVLAHLHASVGTQSWSDVLREAPRGPHSFLLPFFDTNIGHWMKQHGSMNPMQSYEMQSLLQAGDVVIDVGANLGCYTVPFAERVGQFGKVLAFEPFRWLQQVATANVAMNGISNAWVFPVGLGTSYSRFEARPPQLRFFSSPGGVRLQQQQDSVKPDEAMQLYDWDTLPEMITVVSLDELLITRGPAADFLGVPAVEDVRLIKIDVEGMEKEVIAGARQVVQRFRPIIWTENVAYFSSNGKDVSFLQLMDSMEYNCAQAQNAPNDVICMDRQGRGHQIG